MFYLLRLLRRLFVKPEPEPVVTLPYPEAPVDYSRTIMNTFAGDLLAEWAEAYDVADMDFWRRDCDIQVSLRFSHAACCIGQTRQIWVRPEYANPGVLAHEACHIAWQLLTVEERGYFHATFNLARQTDEMLKLAWETKPYMRSNVVESHADCYRYLGRRMPEVLWKYYPKLI